MNEFEMIEKYTSGFDYDGANSAKLDLSELNMSIDIADIDQYPNEQYALLRKNGLGTSDSSIILGVNPFKSREDLIAEKCRDYLTDEEIEVGDKAAVRKGRELEPLIIHKMTQIIGRKVLKPVDMYRHNYFPWIKFNYDGVINKVYMDDGSYQYIPAEIKVVTMFGEKHYDKKKAYFTEAGMLNSVPENYSDAMNSIETKAAQYGIPPYYYTQLQQQIFGLNAPYGFLGVLFEKDWTIRVYYVWRDEAMIRNLIVETSKTWDTIMQRRPATFNLGVTTTSPYEPEDATDGNEPE